MQPIGLYDPTYEHDACGIGFIAHVKGKKSHDIIKQGLLILNNLNHRGAVGADELMGDGAGILVQCPDAFFRIEMAKQGVTLPPLGEYGVGMIFLPKEPASRLACEQALERATRAEGQIVLGWRDVPVDADMPMSDGVKHLEPVIRQIFIGRGADIMVPDALERKLYVIRKSAAHAINALGLIHGKEYFVPSMSTRTIVYKGLLLAHQVGEYYLDLQHPDFISAIALVHQRFSTNTFPTWPLAHPFRMIAHNGEINTVRGNFNWMRAREGLMTSSILGEDLKKLYPLIFEGQSDSACFDNVLELLVMSGYPIAHAMMMMIPEAWENHSEMDVDRRAFYEYHAAMMEPWDGPAAMIFTDGQQIGGTLDRNGLRPARYWVTEDDYVIMASEAGVLPILQEKIVKKWRLQPGKMFLIDLEKGCIFLDEAIKANYANAKPYKSWIDAVRVRLDQLPESTYAPVLQVDPFALQQAFGYTQEEVEVIIGSMAKKAEEPIGSMGDDTPLAPLSSRPNTLYAYFRQLFAQVTNPPIDPIRESLVMSLVSFLGPKPNVLDINHMNPPMRLEAMGPILTQQEMGKLHDIHLHTSHKFKTYVVDICYPLMWGAAGIEARLASICAEVGDAVRLGYNIMIVSDRAINHEKVAIPALLATSAIHQHLIKEGLRTATGLIVDTGSAREAHHFALLAAYGAQAIHPYLAIETIVTKGAYWQVDVDQAVKNYIQAIGKSLMKIMSKMGISTYMSYCGAQIFEAIGLKKTVVDKYFCGTKSRVEGIDLFDIAEEVLALHAQAFQKKNMAHRFLESGGHYAFRIKGEAHMWTPDTIAKLQHATRSNSPALYHEYAALINHQSKRHMTLRGLFEFNVDPLKSILLEEVEPAKEIVKRFVTGAMSLGSISTEAHVSLALAMNRLGGKSNTGEGGEDRRRYEQELAGHTIKAGTTLSDMLGEENIVVDRTLLAGDSLRSKIKQIASARFGVTAAYLRSADQIQIKMAQGAKPGEGGQLPGDKVSDYIAGLRFSVPGVGLISPPPHHDIYSIEDLAQLIHDLKSVHPSASISVKLVSEIGVGTIAAGVAKAKADHIVIAGHDGGTGASPLSSIKYAGSPWELGLAEAHQTLVLNGLRSRVRLQADGQMKTGRDVAIAALLGADEIGFATAPLVALGCIMMRKCHLNTCPVGVATQDPVLRAKFTGQPEHVVNYFFMVAEELRHIMATLGIRSYEEMIGRVDLLKQSAVVNHYKAKGLDFSLLFSHVTPMVAQKEHNQEPLGLVDHKVDKACLDYARSVLSQEVSAPLQLSITNIDRTVGAALSGWVAQHYGHKGLPDHTLQIDCDGIAGQSFGAFLAKGITLTLIGEANDYVGKSLSGGYIVMRQSASFKGMSDHNIICGNTVLYGAICGHAYISGVAGERFAVRNSGAISVVEGVGDHGCEYMTGGTVVILGEIGRNFAAGMSGGLAYLYDEHGECEKKCNLAMVRLIPLSFHTEGDALLNEGETLSMYHHSMMGLPHQTEEASLYALLQSHYRYTGSVKAKKILADWGTYRVKFVKVLPKEYERALTLKVNNHNVVSDKE